MIESFTSTSGYERTRHLILVAVTASMAAWLYSFVFAQLDNSDILRTGLVSDVVAYQDLADAVIAGGWPYLDIPFEHLPVSAVAIIGVGWLSHVTGIGIWILWPLAMAACVGASAVVVDRFAAAGRNGFTFIAVATPLMPLVLFRLEPWVGLLAGAAVGAWLADRVTGGAAASIAATLAKGWPLTLVLIPWRTGRRLAAAAVAGVSVVLLGVVYLQEGFRTGREFDGIHTETLLGSAVIVLRHVLGRPLDLFSAAGAKYVAVPDVAIAINALPGLLLIGTAVWLSSRDRQPRQLVQAVGVLVLGVLLASPLASTQFIWWLTPFIALAARDTRRLYVGVSLVALATITVFAPEALWWASAVFARNVGLLALGIVWIRRIRYPSGTEPLPSDTATLR